MKGDNKMFLNQDNSFTLQAKLTDAAITTQVEMSLTYKDNTDSYHADVILSTNDTTPVTLLAPPPENTVNIVESIKIYNPDTKANTIQILAGNKVIYSCTIGSKESLTLSETGVSNIGNSDSLDTKANESEVVHLAKTETITGDKTFSGSTTIGSSTGILKRISGVVKDAVEGTDYLSPYGNGANLSNVSLIGRNLLINAGFFINQRNYTSGTATTTANQFTLDRWFIPTSGQSLTFFDNNGTRTITAPLSGICQVIEGDWLQSGMYVLSWLGSAIGYVNGIQTKNGSSILITGGNNITIKFINGTVSNPQFELGNTATTFENRFYGTELMLCLRYFIRLQTLDSVTYSYIGIGHAYSSTAAAVMIHLPVTLRTLPTLSYNGVWEFGGVTCTNITIADLLRNGVTLTVNASSGGFDGIEIFEPHNSSSAYIDLNAELIS